MKPYCDFADVALRVEDESGHVVEFEVAALETEFISERSFESQPLISGEVVETPLPDRTTVEIRGTLLRQTELKDDSLSVFDPGLADYSIEELLDEVNSRLDEQ